MKLLCPLCEEVVDKYEHIINDHKEFWDARYPVDPLPTNVEEFNNRFGMIGMYIKTVDE